MISLIHIIGGVKTEVIMMLDHKPLTVCLKIGTGAYMEVVRLSLRLLVSVLWSVCYHILLTNLHCLILFMTALKHNIGVAKISSKQRFNLV